MTDRIADIPQLERKDGIILFLSRINEIERTVVLNRSERSCRLQLEPRERPLSREIPRGRLVKIFAYARTEESSFHGRPTDRERPLIGTPRSSHPLASLGILWPLIISELASNNHRHAMHPSTKLESSRTTAASIIDLTNRADVSWPHPFHALTNSHPLDEKLSKRPKTRPTVSRSISISIYTTQTVPPSLPLPPTVDPSITNRIRMCPVFLLPPPALLFSFFFFSFFFHQTHGSSTRGYRTRLTRILAARRLLGRRLERPKQEEKEELGRVMNGNMFLTVPKLASSLRLALEGHPLPLYRAEPASHYKGKRVI